jgi:acetate kinase
MVDDGGLSPVDVTPGAVLCLNGGSSSLKFAVYQAAGEGEDARRLAEGAVERIGARPGRLWLRDAAGAMLVDEGAALADHQAAVHAAFEALERHGIGRPAAVGHRLVHGGPEHFAPERVTDTLMESLRALIPLAPLHLPSEIAIVEAVTARYPSLPQVICFDTAFHRGMPEVARRFPVPRVLWEHGVRRYGFHGLSYEYVVSRLGADLRPRTIIAHLGNGASMAAVRDGQPLDTTMGFTPTGGIPMGTRSGDLDPGLLFFLARQHGYDTTALERLVTAESGLRGISGISSDMKTLLDRRGDEPAAALAVDMFCYYARKQIGALAAALGGLDLLVFTGGIGERAAPVRGQVCAGLEHLGIRLDPVRNTAGADPLSAPESRCAVRVIPTNEELTIARHTGRVLGPRATRPRPAA